MAAETLATEKSGSLGIGLSRYQWLTLLLCALTFLIEGYDMDTMALAIPTVAPEWGIKATRFSVAIVALNIGAIIGNGFIAPLGDRFGRKRVITVSMLALGLGVAMTASATSIWQLAGWRFVSGLGFGTSSVNVVALIAEQFPRNRRSLLVTLASANLSLGGAVAGFSAAAVTVSFGWRGLFLVGGLSGIAVSALIGGIIRDRRATRAGHKAAEAAGEVTRLSVFRLFAPDLIDVTLPLWLMRLSNTAILFVLSSWLPTMLKGIGWTLHEATRAPAMMSIGGVISAVCLSILLGLGKGATTLRITFAGLIVVRGLFIFMPPSVPIWSGLLLVAGVLCTGSHYAVSALLATLYPSDIRATGAGWGNMMGRIGNISGTLLGAFLLDLNLGVGNTIGLMTVPAVVSLLLTIPLGRAYHRRFHATDC